MSELDILNHRSTTAIVEIDAPFLRLTHLQVRQATSWWQGNEKQPYPIYENNIKLFTIIFFLIFLFDTIERTKRF